MNIFLQTPIPPLFRFAAEARAMGAQWEMVHRIPKTFRENLIHDLKTRAMLNTHEAALDNLITTISKYQSIYRAKGITDISEQQILEILIKSSEPSEFFNGEVKFAPIPTPSPNFSHGPLSTFLARASQADEWIGDLQTRKRSQNGLPIRPLLPKQHSLCINLPARQLSFH